MDIFGPKRSWPWEQASQKPCPLKPIHSNSQNQIINRLLRDQNVNWPQAPGKNQNPAKIDVDIGMRGSCPCGGSDPQLISCFDCDAKLCSHCTNYHQRFKHKQNDSLIPNLSHSLTLNALDEMLSDEYKENLVCGPHDPAKSSLYCETCCEAVCGVCYPAEHCVHEVVTILDALERAKITANMLRAEAAYGSRKMGNLIDKTNNALHQIRVDSRDTERKIHQVMDDLRQSLDGREKALLSELQTAFERQSKALLAEIDSFNGENRLDHFQQAVAETSSCDQWGSLRQIQRFTRHDMDLTKEGEFALGRNVIANAPSQQQYIVVEVLDEGLKTSLATAGKVMIVERHPPKGTIGSEVKRCRSYSPPEQNKKPALDYSSDSHQEDSNDSQPLTQPMWNPWNNVNDVDLAPLLDRGFVIQDSTEFFPIAPPKSKALTTAALPVSQPAESATRPTESSLQLAQNELQAPRADKFGVGLPKLIIGKEGVNDGELCRPWGVCCDQDGNFVIADRSNHRIQVFSPQGAFRFKFGSYGKKDAATFDRPAGVAVDHSGRIIVVDKDNHRIQVFTRDGKFLFMFGSEGARNGQFYYPWGVAVNARGEMAVSDTRNHRVQLFSEDGKFLKKFGFENVSYCCKHFDSPRGLSFTANGSLLVTDFNNHRLVIIDAEFRSAKYMGSEGGMPKQFMRPQGVAVDPEGNIIVADSRNNRIQIFSKDGTYVCQFGSAGKSAGQFDRPSGTCVTPDGKIAVVDFGNNRVQVF